MKKIILLVLLLLSGVCFAQTFYQKNTTSLILDYDVAAVEVSNGYILGDNEVNSAINFHGVIRLMRTDYFGNIIWAKKYDAGSGTTVHLFQLVKTSDNYLLATGYIGPDNNSIASQRFVMKLDTTGSVIWSKQYLSLMAYEKSMVVQLSDTDYVFSTAASSGGNPVLCRIDSGGNVLSAAKFNLTNSTINNIVLHNNSLDLILSNFYVLNTDVSGSVINWQRQYNNTFQFNSLVSNRCANGDLIYMAGQIAGGFGDGTSRIFRTDDSGNLKWSKNILAWRGATSSPGTNFDVVTHIDVQESADGSIVGISLEEGGTLLFSVFDSTGTYLYNRNRTAVGQQHCVTQTASGNYLTGSVFGFNSFSTFSSYPLSPANPCDSILTVSITTGVDSAATMPPVTVSVDIVTSTNSPLTVTPVTVFPLLYCNPVGIAEMENTQPDFSVYPNPASGYINLRWDHPQMAQVRIVNVLSEIVLQQPITKGDNRIDLSEIQEGVYLVTTTFDKQQTSRKLIVLRK